MNSQEDENLTLLAEEAERKFKETCARIKNRSATKVCSRKKLFPRNVPKIVLRPSMIQRARAIKNFSASTPDPKNKDGQFLIEAAFGSASCIKKEPSIQGGKQSTTNGVISVSSDTFPERPDSVIEEISRIKEKSSLKINQSRTSRLENIVDKLQAAGVVDTSTKSVQTSNNGKRKTKKRRGTGLDDKGELNKKKEKKSKLLSKLFQTIDDTCTSISSTCGSDIQECVQNDHQPVVNTTSRGMQTSNNPKDEMSIKLCKREDDCTSVGSNDSSEELNKTFISIGSLVTDKTRQKPPDDADARKKTKSLREIREIDSGLPWRAPSGLLSNIHINHANSLVSEDSLDESLDETFRPQVKKKRSVFINKKKKNARKSTNGRKSTNKRKGIVPVVQNEAFNENAVRRGSDISSDKGVFSKESTSGDSEMDSKKTKSNNNKKMENLNAQSIQKVVDDEFQQPQEDRNGSHNSKPSDFCEKINTSGKVANTENEGTFKKPQSVKNQTGIDKSYKTNRVRKRRSTRIVESQSPLHDDFLEEPHVNQEENNSNVFKDIDSVQSKFSKGDQVLKKVIRQVAKAQLHDESSRRQKTEGSSKKDTSLVNQSKTQRNDDSVTTQTESSRGHKTRGSSKKDSLVNQSKTQRNDDSVTTQTESSRRHKTRGSSRNDTSHVAQTQTRRFDDHLDFLGEPHVNQEENGLNTSKDSEDPTGTQKLSETQKLNKSIKTGRFLKKQKRQNTTSILFSDSVKTQKDNSRRGKTGESRRKDNSQVAELQTRQCDDFVDFIEEPGVRPEENTSLNIPNDIDSVKTQARISTSQKTGRIQTKKQAQTKNKSRIAEPQTQSHNGLVNEDVHISEPVGSNRSQKTNNRSDFAVPFEEQPKQQSSHETSPRRSTRERKPSKRNFVGVVYCRSQYEYNRCVGKSTLCPTSNSRKSRQSRFGKSTTKPSFQAISENDEDDTSRPVKNRVQKGKVQRPPKNPRGLQKSVERLVVPRVVEESVDILNDISQVESESRLGTTGSRNPLKETTRFTLQESLPSRKSIQCEDNDESYAPCLVFGDPRNFVFNALPGMTGVSVATLENIKMGFLRIDPGHAKSKQRAVHNNFRFIVLEGQAKVGVNDKEYTCSKFGSFAVLAGSEYFIQNSTKKSLLINYSKF